ncbi:type I-E CRISPR-associated protein Cse1/CasA [Pilimelia anulata]|uniref:Type I-E CRISPR-associated protein Cse1/CasA n=1 Tax=Pilimelia anulata TaxID=53371 RepID=A0A8J3BBK3_9ACTN|nr:type I-E CRISPR-associated protein Cse1/CasA [Pilimelia anulata]GGJ92614.1 type I-E CRISPR-associated protein Cse1/CasA [Pilimelia anulata]
MIRFDLTSQAWIPVVDGAAVSVRQALVEGHRLADLSWAQPLEAVAVLRQVLLPVYLDACGPPRDEADWADRWKHGRLNGERIAAYLDRHADCFDLFGEKPFAQVADLRTAKDETKPTSVLSAAVATGNNVPLFAARTDGNPPVLDAATAARALLAAQCWDTAAIKSGAADDPAVSGGKTTGNPTGPLGAIGPVVPLGRTLAETILLNVPLLRHGFEPDDVPQWHRDRPGPGWATRHPTGLLDLLTWQARRIRLVPRPGTTGIEVAEVVLCAGDRLLPDKLLEYEPHTAWRPVDKPRASDPVARPIRHQPGRAAWQGLSALLAARPGAELPGKPWSPNQLGTLHNLAARDDLASDYPLRVAAVGVVYGNQSAVVEDVLADFTPLPVLALADSDPTGGGIRVELDAMVAMAERLRIAANRLGDDLRRSCGGEPAGWDSGQRPGDLLVHRLSPIVHRLLAGLQRQPDRLDEGLAAWRAAARRECFAVVEPILASCGPTAFRGRAETKKDPKSDKKKEDVMRASTAEARFRWSVHRILAVVDG